MRFPETSCLPVSLQFVISEETGGMVFVVCLESKCTFSQ